MCPFISNLLPDLAASKGLVRDYGERRPDLRPTQVSEIMCSFWKILKKRGSSHNFCKWRRVEQVIVGGSLPRSKLMIRHLTAGQYGPYSHRLFLSLMPI